MTSFPSSSIPFLVARKVPELVKPAKPTSYETKQLSDIDDQQGLRFQLPMIWFYKNKSNPLMKEKGPVRVIREALAKALVFYYPFAGRLVEKANRKLMVECNGEGVLFTEAHADVKLQQLGDLIYLPLPYWNELLHDVPGSGEIVGCPLLLIQVTRFICGGYSFAIRLNHAMSDGFGIVRFLYAIMEMAQGASEPSLIPIWQRELLNARSPPLITCVYHQYEELDDDHGFSATMDNENQVYRSFFFGPKEIQAIKKHLPPHMQSSSTFEVLTARLWRSRTIALAGAPDEIFCLTFMVRMQLPSGYYGNGMASTAAISKANLLCRRTLEYAVELVKKAKADVNEEYITSLADFLVTKGRPPFRKKRNYIVSDTSKTGMGEVDLGWGKPEYSGSIVDPTLPASSYVRVRNSKGEEGLVVPIRLPIAAMERFQEELRKMTQEPMEDSYNMKPVRVTSML